MTASGKLSDGEALPNWDLWPARRDIGNCRISVEHEGSRAVNISAQPLAFGKDEGAFISCRLPVTSRSDINIELSDSTYWSSRRRGPSSSHYFYEGHPKVTVAVLYALETEAFRDRVRALCYLFLTPSGYDPRPGEGIYPLGRDPKGFKEAANRWIQQRTQSKEGLKELSAARKHLEEAEKYSRSLFRFEALTSPETSRAKPVQTAVLLAIKTAVFESKGIPLIADVRREYLTIAAAHREKHKPPLEPGRLYASPAEDNKGLQPSGFDTAINKLGFSWLPRSWELSRD